MESPFSKGNHVAEIEMKEESSSNVQIGIVTWNVNHFGEINLIKSLSDFIEYLLWNEDFYADESADGDLAERIYSWIITGEKYNKSEDGTGYESIKKKLSELIILVLSQWDIKISEKRCTGLLQLLKELSPKQYEELKGNKNLLQKQKAMPLEEDDDEDKKEIEYDSEEDEEPKSKRKRKDDDDDEYQPEPGEGDDDEENDAEWDNLVRNKRESLKAEVKKELKKIQLVRQISALFEKNSWLNVMILQEVNEGGIEELEKRIPASLKLKIIRGPKMKSYNEGQREYYPVIVRENIEVSGFYISDEYTHLKENKKENKIVEKEHNWNKRIGSFRPVIVYKLLIDNNIVFIGNLHTTPGKGGEFFRQEEYEQIREAILKASAISGNATLIIGGDFYLFRESRVIDPELVIYLGDKDFRDQLYWSVYNILSENIRNEDTYDALSFEQIEEKISGHFKLIEEQSLGLATFKNYYFNLLFLRKFCSNFLSISGTITAENAARQLLSGTDFDSLVQTPIPKSQVLVTDYFTKTIHSCFNEVVRNPSIAPHIEEYIVKDLNAKRNEQLNKLIEKDKLKKIKLKEKETIKEKAARLVYNKEIVKSWKQKINALLAYFALYLKEKKQNEIKSIKLNSVDLEPFSHLKFLRRENRVDTFAPLVKREGDDFVRADLHLTFAHEMAKAKIDIAQPIYGSNRHRPSQSEQKSTFYSISRVADFFLYKNIQFPVLQNMHVPLVGHMHPSGGIILADDDELSVSRYWRTISDHFPIGAFFGKHSGEKIFYDNEKDIRKKVEELSSEQAIWLLTAKISQLAKSNDLFPFISETQDLKSLLNQNLSKALTDFFDVAMKTVKMEKYSILDFGQEFGTDLNDIRNEIYYTGDEDLPDKKGKEKASPSQKRLPKKIDTEKFTSTIKKYLHQLLFKSLYKNIFDEKTLLLIVEVLSTDINERALNYGIKIIFNEASEKEKINFFIGKYNLGLKVKKQKEKNEEQVNKSKTPKKRKAGSEGGKKSDTKKERP